MALDPDMNISSMTFPRMSTVSVLAMLLSSTAFAAGTGVGSAPLAATAPLSSIGGISAPASAPIAAYSTAAAVEGANAGGEAPSEAEQLTKLRARIPLLAAQAEIAELEAKIAQAKALANRDPNAAVVTPNNAGSVFAQGMPGGAQQMTTQPVKTTEPEHKKPIASSASSTAFQVAAINGFDGEYRAVLSIQGSNVPVGPGDVVSGWRVVSISADSVTLTRGGKRIELRQE
jgi:type IV pilus biogenesis protein PilP